ncbi:MAG: hypothetical protein MZV49_22355 [Rhodopseudomonas palustris]|nr:hypothetical protein [Rhodopseudomonas palustris]
MVIAYGLPITINDAIGAELRGRQCVALGGTGAARGLCRCGGGVGDRAGQSAGAAARRPLARHRWSARGAAATRRR